MVGVNEVFYDNIVEDLVFLFYYLIEDRISIFVQEEEGGYFDFFEVVFIFLGFSYCLAGIEFFVGGVDEDNKKRNIFFIFVGFIYEKFKRMWVYRSSFYIVKREVFFGNCQVVEWFGVSVGGSRTSYI